jgi:hypothetical protein
MFESSIIIKDTPDTHSNTLDRLSLIQLVTSVCILAN